MTAILVTTILVLAFVTITRAGLTAGDNSPEGRGQLPRWAEGAAYSARRIGRAPAVSHAHKPLHWVEGKGDQGWQWKWQVWLPAKWQRVGVCETQLNWSHANSSYVSAFGIYRTQYDADARSMGAPPWSDRRPPSPWHQYRAALGHYRMFGGFSGWGCRNA